MSEKLNKSIFLEGARLFVRNYAFPTPMLFDISHDYPFIKLNFVLEGNCSFEPKYQDSIHISVAKGQYNFFYLPKVRGELSMQPEVYSSVDVECDEAFFKRLFKTDFFEISGKFGEALKAQVPFKMHDTAREIDSFLREKVEAIVNGANTEEPDTRYLEKLLIDTFRYLFYHLDDSGILESSPLLKSEDWEKVVQAEKILSRRLNQTITVDELATAVGTNRDKLNRNFKKVYNEPVFSYLTRIRMEHAKELLLKDDLTIGEVADAVGYKNQQHFTVAFKKKYNQLPKYLKRG